MRRWLAGLLLLAAVSPAHGTTNLYRKNYKFVSDGKLWEKVEEVGVVLMN